MARYIRYEHGGETRYGELKGTEIRPLRGEFGRFETTGEAAIDLSLVKLLAPVAPSKIVAIGPNFWCYFPDKTIVPPPLNLWLKPATALNDPEGIIEIPPGRPATNHEVELGIVIGKKAKRVREKDAHDYIFGYTCVNDVTVADFETPGAFQSSPYFTYGKTFDGFAPVGPCIVTDLDTSDLHMECRVNGEIRMSSSSADQIRKPAELVALISDVVTLLPGDIISTGTFMGVKPLRDGDAVEIEIENIGILRNHCRARSNG